MRITTYAALVVIAVATMVAGAAPSTAATGEGFGQHVSDCVHDMRFSGTQNPGMHRGLSGWDGRPC